MPPPRRRGWHSRDGPSRAGRRERRCDAPLTARPARAGEWAATGDIYQQSHGQKGVKKPRDNLSRGLLLQIRFLFRLAQLGRLLGLPVIQQRDDLLFHLGGSDLLAKILFQFRSRNDHAAILLFLFR